MNRKKELHIPVAYINTGVCSSFYVRHNALSYTMLRQSKFESILSEKNIRAPHSESAPTDGTSPVNSAQAPLRHTRAPA